MISRFSLLSLCALATASCAQNSAPPSKEPAPATHFVKETGFTYGPWRSSVLGGGGYVQNVVPAPSNPQRFYAYIDVGGLCRSDDGAKSWRMLHGHLPASLGSTEVRGLSVDPRDDKKILVATGSQYSKDGGIYRSDDAGETFQKVLDASYSGNGGTRWMGFVLTRDMGNPDVVMTASIGDGAFRSADNGKTWASVGAKGLHPTDLDIDRTNSQRAWLCASGDKVGKNEFAAGFYRSDDAGANWQKLSDAAPSEIVQDPKTGAIYGIFNGSSLIKKSVDGGATWADWSNGLNIQPVEDGKEKPSISTTGYRALEVGPDFVLTGTTSDAQFYKLAAGADTWQKVERNAPAVGDWFRKGSWYFGGAMGSITVDPNDAKHWFITDFFAIYQSFDAGKNWRLTIDGIESTVSHDLLQDPSDAAVVHLGEADIGPATSLDGGRRFLPDDVVDEGANKKGGGNMKSIDLSPKMPARLYGVGNKSWQGGWSANQVFVSQDRGQIWRRTAMQGLPNMSGRACTTIVADLNDADVAYLTVSGKIGANSGGVYKSRDGGAQWTPMSEGLPQDGLFFPSQIWAHGHQLAVSGDGSLVALSQSQNLVYRFDPQTKIWSNTGLRAKGGRLWSVAADRLKPGRFFVGARGDGIYRTDDGGQNWKKVFDQGAAYVATDAAVANRVAAGTEDGVILSEDGGDTWKMLDKSLPYRSNNNPAFAGEHLLVGSGGSGVFWMPLSAAGENAVAAKDAPKIVKTPDAAPKTVAAPAPETEEKAEGDAEGKAENQKLRAQQDPRVPVVRDVTWAGGNTWQKTHEKYVARAQQGDVDVVFFGDSITQWWPQADFKARYGPLGGVNFGIGGDRTQNLLWRVRNGEMDGITPKVAVLMIGTNNAFDNKPEEIVEATGLIIKTIREKSPTTKVLLLAVFPRDREAKNVMRKRVNGINALLPALADGKNVVFADLGAAFLDKNGALPVEVSKFALHLSPEGYRRWAEAMQPYLDKLLDSPKPKATAAK